MFMGMGRVLGIVVVLVLLAAPAASAATAQDRAAARSFAAAADRFARDARAALPLSLVATQQASLDCHLAGVRRARENGAPPTAIIRASLEGLAIAQSIIYLTAVGNIETFLKRIDRVPTKDPALRAGRTAWRQTLRSMRVYLTLPFPTDICARVDAWVNRGATGAMFPNLDFTRVNREMTSSASVTRESRIERAAERMRSLGQSRTRANRFTVREALAQQLSVEQQLVAPYAPAG